jgi:hypothetical protein
VAKCIIAMLLFICFSNSSAKGQKCTFDPKYINLLFPDIVIGKTPGIHCIQGVIEMRDQILT